MKTPPRTLGLALAALVAWTLSGPRALAAEMRTYLSLGDSLAFGYTTPADSGPSLGDQGYVAPYADFLATRYGGVRPHVVNLAIPTESTDSFFTGGQPATALNLNYPDSSTSQFVRLLQTVTAERAAGREITDVTVALGANDLFTLAGTPGFLALPPDQQQAQIAQALGALAGRYASLLATVRFALPDANLALVGLYNPFPAAPDSPLAALAGPAIGALNQAIAAQAAAFGADFVDLSAAFAGHEAEFTFITELDASGAPNVHPNAAGYAAIAQQIQSVPEPASLVVVGAGLAGLAGAARRRRRAG